VECTSKTNLKEGETYKMRMSVKGMKIHVHIEPDLDADYPVPFSVAPSGGVGVAVEPGAKVHIKSLRLRSLRTEAFGKEDK
jgi:hypothetical protein